MVIFRNVALVFAALLSLLLSVSALGANGEAKQTGDPGVRLELRLGRNECYAGEPVSVSLVLISTGAEIASVEKRGDLQLKGGEWASMQPVDNPGRPFREVIDGRPCTVYPLETAMVSWSDKGKYTLLAPDYTVGISVPVIVNDPFWGRRRAYDVRNVELSAPERRIKVKDLPEVPEEINFTGSVGDFTIETIVPRGEIVVGDEATVYVVLRGTGLIAERTVPEYRDAFGKGLKLKSLSELRNAAFDKGKMISELQLECTIEPTERGYLEIGPVSFDYFDPVAGKYRRALSAPVGVNVKSSTSRRERMDV